jgi:hypothetical protein
MHVPSNNKNNCSIENCIGLAVGAVVTGYILAIVVSVNETSKAVFTNCYNELRQNNATCLNLAKEARLEVGFGIAIGLPLAAVAIGGAIYWARNSSYFKPSEYTAIN